MLYRVVTADPISMLLGVILLCESEAQDTFLLGELLTFFGWDLGLFNDFLPTRCQRLEPEIEPMTVQSLDLILSR